MASESGSQPNVRSKLGLEDSNKRRRQGPLFNEERSHGGRSRLLRQSTCQYWQSFGRRRRSTIRIFDFLFVFFVRGKKGEKFHQMRYIAYRWEVATVQGPRKMKLTIQDLVVTEILIYKQVESTLQGGHTVMTNFSMLRELLATG